MKEIIINRKWAMPNSQTFKIKPISELISKYVGSGLGWIDPWKFMRFDSDWNWLMPVVEKLETMYNDCLIFIIKDTRAHVEIDTQGSLVYDVTVPECYSGFCATKIGAAYSTVIEFINWHNTQKNSYDR